MPTAQLDRPQTTAADASTMTAVVQAEYGDAPEDVLAIAEVARPAVRDGEVLVHVRAASVDRGTWHIMAGLPYPIRLAGFGVRRPKHGNPGRSLAGTVEAVGAGVTGFAPGDDVYGIAPGSFAEYVNVEPAKLAPMPRALTYEEAAALPISGLTALQGVRDHAKVRPGDKVLVIGASGGVGSFAVQIAKALGAEVTGVASAAKLEMVRALGADHVLDYTREAIGGGYDVILDTGGNRGLGELRRALTPRGRLVIVGGEGDGRWLGGSDRGPRAHLLSIFVGQSLGTYIASENAADLEALAALVESGAVRPAVDRVYPLAETAAAIRRMLDGKARGKVVISL